MSSRFSADAFSLGKAPAVLLAAALVAGLFLLFNPVEQHTATLRLWTFARTHYLAYVESVPAFAAKHPDAQVQVQLVHGEAVTSRLRAAFWADLDVPDLVEVEISSTGSFFRGPLEDVGFVDLLPLLKQSGFYERIVQTRLAPYSHRGRVFGLPHDVHPVMLAYRRDLLEAAGVDVAQIETWEDFVAVGRRLTQPGERYLIELSDSGAHHYEMFLFQRDGGYFDAAGQVRMDDEQALATLLFYIPLVAGPERIAADLGAGQLFTQAIEEGYFLSFVCPDWRSKIAETDVPRLAGKMALMPLPAAAPGGRRTSTWGGTMLGITKACSHPELAWEAAVHFYLDKEELAERFRQTNILPPLKDAWDLPAFKEPHPYWSNQPLGALYAALAEQVPPQYASPFVALAKSKMSEVIAACAAYYRQHNTRGFADFARERLHLAGDQVRAAMQRNPY